MQAPWLILYILLGPAPWLLFAIAMALANARMNRLRRPMPRIENPPAVTILIPAKDEGQRIGVCLESVLAQDYPHFTVLAVDDRSADATGAIMDEYAGVSNGKLRTIHIPKDGLPPGWLGKCHALHTAAQQVSTDWLLFVDSDVRLAPDALSCVLSLAEGRKYDAVSLMTRLECESFLERLVLPLAAASVSAMCLVSLTNDDHRKVAFANGQFFLIRKSAYEAVGGHEAVKDHITEDVALMRMMKSSGSHVRLFLGTKFASTRMHATFKQMLQGWGRIFSGVSSRRPWRILAAMFFVLTGLAAWIGVIAAARMRSILPVAAAHLILVTIVLAVLYHWSGNRKRYALLFPIAGPILISLYLYALKMCVTGRVAWRGTSYTYTPATEEP